MVQGHSLKDMTTGAIAGPKPFQDRLFTEGQWRAEFEDRLKKAMLRHKKQWFNTDVDRRALSRVVKGVIMRMERATDRHFMKFIEACNKGLKSK
jgi:hypothetical protein